MSNQDDIENSVDDPSPKEIEIEQTNGIEAGESVIEKTDLSTTEIEVTESVTSVKRRPDPLTISFAILALAVIVGFGVYFYFYIRSNVSLGMTLMEFQTSYHATDGFIAISPVGLSFPDCTISNLDPSGKKDDDEIFYSGEVLSLMDYNIYVSGSINKSNAFIRSMQVSVTIPEGADIAELQKELCVVFMPFIQSIYPEMIPDDAVAFSQNLFATQDVVIRGDFAVSTRVDEAAGLIYLNIIPKEKA
jgi:hypothetical protein